MYQLQPCDCRFLPVATVADKVEKLNSETAELPLEAWTFVFSCFALVSHRSFLDPDQFKQAK